MSLSDELLQIQKELEKLVKANASSKRLMELIAANAKIAANEDGNFSQEEMQQAKENMLLIARNKQPRWNLGPGTVVGGKAPHQKIEEEYNKLASGSSGAAQNNPAMQDVSRLKEQRADIAEQNQRNQGPMKISDLRTPERTAEQQRKAGIVAAARKEAKAQAATTEKPYVKRRAQLTAANLQDAKIELNDKGIPKYHEVFQNYTDHGGNPIDEKMWNGMDDTEKLLHLVRHYETAKILPQNKLDIKLNAPKYVPEESVKEWHSLPIEQKLHIHKHWQSQNPVKVEPQQQAAAKPTLPPAQPTDNTKVNKSIERLSELFKSLRAMLDQ